MIKNHAGKGCGSFVLTQAQATGRANLDLVALQRRTVGGGSSGSCGGMVGDTNARSQKYGAGGGVLDPSIPRQGQEY